MFSRTVLNILAVGLLAVASVHGSDRKPSLKSIGEGVICQCGCNENLNICPHYNCSSKAEMHDLIQKEIGQGKDETTILQDLVLRYGVKVLATPPAKGFNLAVWILPGVGLVVGFLVVIAFVRRWRKSGSGSLAKSPAPADPKLLAAVEDEMRKVAG